MKRQRLAIKELDGVMNAYLIGHQNGMDDPEANDCTDELLRKYANQIYCDLHLLRLCYSVVARTDHTSEQALDAAKEVVSETATSYCSATQLNLAKFCVSPWPTEHLLELK